MGILRVAEIVHVIQHRQPQRLGAPELRISSDLVEGRGGETRRRVGIDRSMRNKQGTRARVEKRPREPGQGFGTGLIAGNRVAGG
jgi:hypothetical protein